MITKIKDKIILTKSGPVEWTRFAQSEGLDIGKAEELRKRTMASEILEAHAIGGNGDSDIISLKFDGLASHDITYVGIIQTARASGLEKFPVPYVLTNCHNSLCAVGGTINEDDHKFGLSACVKYGGIFVPPHQAVIHQYMREMMAAPGKMLIGSDSHTRYGALGTMAVGEGGPELVKQLLERPYQIRNPETVLVYFTGKPKPGVGPQDVALAIIKETFGDGFVKNRVMEFCGPGVANLSMDYRIGIDVMTTETTCWSSVWTTDEKTKQYLSNVGRANEYRRLEPGENACYDGLLEVNLSGIEPMIALPFHPSNGYTIKEFLQNAEDILDYTEKEARRQYGNSVREYSLKEKYYDGKMHTDQGVIAGCSGGTYENIVHAADILRGRDIGNGGYTLSVYPASQPVYSELIRNGYINDLMTSGAVIRSAFCGPCFGAGDVPSNNGFSIRHTTRNFPNREGSRPSDGQISWVALMDARSIAATSLNGGILTAATEIDDLFAIEEREIPYHFDEKIYKSRVYNGFKAEKTEQQLKFGPNIADWPEMESLTDNILLEVACVITDPVTTTDELIPSGETSSYRSNPEKLSGFALSRKDPEYVGRAKAVREKERARLAYLEGTNPDRNSFADMFEGLDENLISDTQIGTVVVAVKPGDGSAREQAASCQKVLGGFANISESYATKRYRSNLINWGMIPFTVQNIVSLGLKNGDRLFIRGIREAVMNGRSEISATVTDEKGRREIMLTLGGLSEEERRIILAGSLINYYSGK